VDVQVMQNLLSQAVAGKAQAIATWSLGAAAAFDALFAQARAQGGLVATLLSGAATKNQNFEVGLREAQQARMRIQAVAKRSGQQYVGVIAQQHSGPEYSEYVPALKDEVAKHPNVTLEDIRYDHGNFTADLTLASAMLTAHREINVLVNYSGFPGVLTAIKEKHLVGKVFAITSTDFPKVAVGYIKEGLIAGIQVHDGCATGKLVVQKFLDAWAGKPVDRYYSDGYRIVTGEAFKSLIAQGYR
jgi:ABC-type sugar transport system substrate-binding protein